MQESDGVDRLGAETQCEVCSRCANILHLIQGLGNNQDTRALLLNEYIITNTVGKGALSRLKLKYCLLEEEGMDINV